MATRANIIAHSQGRWLSIYLHWDGYPEHAGEVLSKHYTTQDKVDGLMALGGLSSLHEHPDAPMGHSYDHPINGHCVAYSRDRKETDMRAKVFDSLEQALEEDNLDGEYVYVWDTRINNNWMLCTPGQEAKDLQDVRKHLPKCVIYKESSQ